MVLNLREDHESAQPTVGEARGRCTGVEACGHARGLKACQKLTPVNASCTAQLQHGPCDPALR